MLSPDCIAVSLPADRFRAPTLGIAAALAVLVSAASAQTADGGFTNPDHFMQQDGAALYRSICQGCHMPEGVGAVGAGSYPALARNEKLAAAGYPVTIVVNGRNGMPGFARMLSDVQIAAVVNYTRTHFGNAYTDSVSDADVKAARP
jgi:mono/diheme cytochrome c family protein